MIFETIFLFVVENWAKIYPKPQNVTFKWHSLAYLLKAKATKQ